MFKFKFGYKLYIFIVFLLILTSLTGFLNEKTHSESTYDLNISIEGEGKVHISPEKDFYQKNEEVLITADPKDGWSFYFWDGGFDGDKNPVKLLMNSDKDIIAKFNKIKLPSIYGDREPAELIMGLISNKYDGSLNGSGFYDFFNRNDKAIIIHEIGDRLTTEQSQRLFDMSLRKLDQITKKQGIYFKNKYIAERPVLLISTKNLLKVEETYNNNSNFQESMDKVIRANYESEVSSSKDNIVWESSGHTPKVFQGLFKNPNYSNLKILLEEDSLTERTRQVNKVAEIINDNKDFSTLKEIYNLLRGISTDKSPENTFEVSASQILSTPITGGCSTYATAFATLARAKGIPTVVIDSATLNWINEGCSLNHVQGHFWVEVLINGEWYLVNSTGGSLYKNYDRSNWYLPEDPYKYIAFSKSLSPIDTGASEYSHNSLQKIAFIKKDINYKEPNYPEVDLFNENIRNEMKNKYDSLNLEVDEDYNIDTSGNKFNIEASSTPEDLGNIPY